MSKEMKEKYDLIVIGGGASGMMAAGAAAENGKKVLILEKNPRLGEKLSITGGGRCNVTNATFDVREFLKKFGDSAKFLFSPFSQFNIQDTFDFFEKRNLPLVVEARNRAFPKTQKASDVVKVMKKYASGKNINISTGNPVIKVVADKEQRNIKYIETRIGKYYADNFIIATGGSSHQETGSTGDGFKWLKKIGHTVKESSPNIVPLKASDKWVKDLSGTSLSFMKITFFVNGKKSFSKVGKILFTHFGLSGPLILNSAHKVRDLLHEGSVTAKIDCYPDTDHGSLEKNILKTFDNNKNKSFKNIAKEITPPGLENALIEYCVKREPEEFVEKRRSYVRKLIEESRFNPTFREKYGGQLKEIARENGVHFPFFYPFAF